MISRDLIIELAQERIDELNKDLFIVELSISGNNNIQLEVDSAVGFVTIDDCVRISRNIEHNLDREVQDFELSVSSAGLDKPLRHKKQYPKNIGRTLKIKTSSGQNLEGKLTKINEEAIEINFEEAKSIDGKKKKEKILRTLEVLFNQIVEAKVVISFK
jgi:ribosome maturation factor RimP